MGITSLRRYHDRHAKRAAVEAAESGDAPDVVLAPHEGEGTEADAANAEQHEADLREQAGNAEANADDVEDPSVHELVEDAPAGTPSAEIPPAGDLPAGNASTEAWQAYAEADPSFEDDPAGWTRSQLVEHYRK